MVDPPLESYGTAQDDWRLGFFARYAPLHAGARPNITGPVLSSLICWRLASTAVIMVISSERWAEIVHVCDDALPIDIGAASERGPENECQWSPAQTASGRGYIL